MVSTRNLETVGEIRYPTPNRLLLTHFAVVVSQTAGISSGERMPLHVNPGINLVYVR